MKKLNLKAAESVPTEPWPSKVNRPILSAEVYEKIGKLEPWRSQEDRMAMAKGFCPYCEIYYSPLEFVSPMTMYPVDKLDENGNDSNYVGFMCARCAQQYREIWDERWAEYYSGLL